MAIIGQETIQKILDDTDIVELIQGYFPLKRAGVNFVALCPFHNEKTPSFNVNPQRQIFHCFGCQAGGDAIKFVMMYDNLPFPDAAKRLADRAGITVQEETLSPQEEAKVRGRRELMRLQRTAADWFHRLLFKSPAAQPARDYLRSRGLTMEVSRNWKFGFAPENQRVFFDWARAEGFTVEQLVDGGLAKWRDEDNPERGAYSFFRHRLMFPVNNDMGEPVAFSGRVLSPDQGGGKYVNSPETSLFNKSRTFFGLDRSKRPILRENRAIVCEGQLDLVAAYEAGVENVVAPLGTAFTEDHARVLKRHTDEVVLCFDSDEAGLNAAGKAFRTLAPSGVMVRLALLPEGEDPDSLIRGRGVDALRQVLDDAPEFFDYQIDRRGGGLESGTLRDRLNFARDIAEDIALVDDKMLQDSLIRRITVRLGVGEEEVRKLVRNAVLARQRAEKTRQRREAVAARRDREREGEGARDEGAESAPARSSSPVTIENRSIRLLCKGLLTDGETRRHVTARPIPDFFENLPGTEIVAQVWRADLDADSHASVNAFLGTLDPGQQQCLARLVAEDSTSVTPELADACLAALRRQSIKNQIAVTKSRLNSSDLTPEEDERLNKQLLDLRAQLNEPNQP